MCALSAALKEEEESVFEASCSKQMGTWQQENNENDDCGHSWWKKTSCTLP